MLRANVLAMEKHEWVSRAGVGCVSEERHTTLLGVNTNLMGSAVDWIRFDEIKGILFLEETKVSDGGFTLNGGGDSPFLLTVPSVGDE